MDLPKRKSNRIKGYDYSQNGVYFITVCTRDRENLLSEITVGDGVLDVPQNKLTEYGKIVNKYILQASGNSDLFVEEYVIMPNHIHLLIRVSNQNGTSRAPSPTANALIPMYISTLKRFCNRDIGRNIWQRSFYDHIVRNEDDYLNICEYIETNPLKWDKDRFYKM